MSLSVSVAMTLFNGEKYLVEQLDSIRNQTIKPDELYATDDGSTDLTREVFFNYIEQFGLKDSWHYINNPNKLGYSENFLHCAELCSGDVIFFSDQDDIWKPKKIEKMVQVLENEDEIQAVVCGYQPYSDGKIIHSKIEKLKMFREKDGKVSFCIQVKDMLSGGLTLCVRNKAFIEMVPYIREKNLPYDVPVGLICAARNSYYRINEPLVLHRIHALNTGDPILTIEGRINSLERHIKGRQFEVDNLIGVRDACFKYLNDSDRRSYDNEIDKRMLSLQYMKNRKILKLFFLMFRIGKYDNKLIDIANFICCLKNQ